MSYKENTRLVIGHLKPFCEWQVSSGRCWGSRISFRHCTVYFVSEAWGAGGGGDRGGGAGIGWGVGVGVAGEGMEGGKEGRRKKIFVLMQEVGQTRIRLRMQQLLSPFFSEKKTQRFLFSSLCSR